MKTNSAILLCAALCMVCLFCMVCDMAFAQNQAQNNGRCNVAIVQPLVISDFKSLDFGTFAPTTRAGTVIVVHDASNGNTQSAIYSNVGGPIHQGPDQESPQDWKITGQPNFLVQLITSNPTTLTLYDDNDHTKTMTFNPEYPPYVMDAGTTYGNYDGQSTGPGSRGVVSPIYIQLDATGNAWTSEGGQLNVNANQAPGHYTGTWTETVSYQ